MWMESERLNLNSDNAVSLHEAQQDMKRNNQAVSNIKNTQLIGYWFSESSSSKHKCNENKMSKRKGVTLIGELSSTLL